MGQESELKYTCPDCGQHLGYDAAQAGQSVPCPTCGTSLQLPEAAPSSLEFIPPEPPSPRGIGFIYLKVMGPIFLALIVCLVFLRPGLDRVARQEASFAASSPNATASSGPASDTEPGSEPSMTADQIQIRVLDTASGKGVQGRLRVFWSANPPAEPEWVETDEDGLGYFGVPRGQISKLRVYTYCNLYEPRMLFWTPSETNAMPREYTFHLRRGTTIGGLVADENGQPISNARIHFRLQPVAEADATEQTGLDGQRHPATTDSAGRWTCVQAPEDLTRLFIQVRHKDTGEKWFRADDASPAPPFTSADLLAGRAQMKMTRLVPLAGRLVDAQGQPVSQAQVVRMEPHELLRLGLGRLLMSKAPAGAVAETGADGSFGLSIAEQTTHLAAAHPDLGFVIASVEDVRSSGTIQLRPWGRLEGTLHINGSPVSGAQLRLIHPPRPDAPLVLDSRQFSAPTTDQGTFAFERLPSADLELLLIPSQEAGPTPGQRLAKAQIESGATASLNLRGTSVRGRLNAEPVTERVDWRMSQCALVRQADEATGAVQEGYFVVPNPTGDFEFALVPPGAYELRITLVGQGASPRERGPVLARQVGIPVVVPDTAAAAGLDLGVVKTEAAEPPEEPGQPR